MCLIELRNSASPALHVLKFLCSKHLVCHFSCLSEFQFRKFKEERETKRRVEHNVPRIKKINAKTFSFLPTEISILFNFYCKFLYSRNKFCQFVQPLRFSALSFYFIFKNEILKHEKEWRRDVSYMQISYRYVPCLEFLHGVQKFPNELLIYFL